MTSDFGRVRAGSAALIEGAWGRAGRLAHTEGLCVLPPVPR